MPVTRQQAIAVAMQAAKAHPEPYMVAGFQPHPWVISAIVLAAAETSRPQMVSLLEVKKAVIAAGFGICSLSELELLQRLEELCIHGIGIGADAMREALARETVAELAQWHGTAHHPVAEALYKVSCRLQKPADDDAPAAGPSTQGLSEQDALLINQAHELLLELAADQHTKGNDSAAAGATCSADAVLRLGAKASAYQPDAADGASPYAQLQRTAVGWQQRAEAAEKKLGRVTQWAIAAGVPPEKIDAPDCQPKTQQGQKEYVIGAHIHREKLYATVMTKDANAVFTVLAVAEVDASLLVKGGVYGPMAPALRTDQLSDAQITAGAAITTMAGMPIGRNVAIDVWEAMCKAGQEGGAA